VSLPVLTSDCSSCFGLCCVLLPFSREAGFGATKAGGTPCHHLDDHDRCGIHDSLRERGWPGCTVFECFGAGQHVSRVTYGGVSWREHDNLGEMAAVLSVVRVLHEMMALLGEAEERGSREARPLLERLVAMGAGTPEELLAVDVDDVRAEVGPVLTTVSAAVRGGAGQDHTHADLAGKDLRRRDLRGASLRGALLIRADLRGADLTDADLLGADLRDADVRGAQLAGSLFLTQPQANAALGDAATTLPEGVVRPGHWS
jgi:hypothetical protein